MGDVDALKLLDFGYLLFKLLVVGLQLTFDEFVFMQDRPFIDVDGRQNFLWWLHVFFNVVLHQQKLRLIPGFQFFVDLS